MILCLLQGYSSQEQLTVEEEAKDAAAAEQKSAAWAQEVEDEFARLTQAKDNAKQESQAAQHADEVARQAAFASKEQLLEQERQHNHATAMLKSADKLWKQLHNERNVTDTKLAQAVKKSAELTASAVTITQERNEAIARFAAAERDREEAYLEYSRPDSTEEDEQKAHETEKEAEEAGICWMFAAWVLASLSCTDWSEQFV